MTRSFDGREPTIADSAYVDERAVVIGNVTIEAEASVWPGAVLRGDHGEIVLEEGANVQDNATVHEGSTIGPYATVGHNAIVLDRATVGAESLVAANSVVTEDATVPESVLVVGAPAEVRKKVEDSPWATAADHYVELAGRYAETSEVLERGSLEPDSGTD